MRVLIPAVVGVMLAIGQPAGAPVSPRVGDQAPEFALMSLEAREVHLRDELSRGPVVLVLLRGWPGYDCPFCTRQFADYLAHAGELGRTGARVLFVYPGPADQLRPHAEAFVRARAMPAGYVVLLDPDYLFTRAYGLRWEAPGETAFPATFVIDKTGTVRFARISRGHGDRVPVADVLRALAPG